MFWARLYSWLWESERERECQERDYGMINAALTRPLTGDEPLSFWRFVQRVFGL